MRQHKRYESSLRSFTPKGFRIFCSAGRLLSHCLSPMFFRLANVLSSSRSVRNRISRQQCLGGPNNAPRLAFCVEKVRKVGCCRLSNVINTKTFQQIVWGDPHGETLYPIGIHSLKTLLGFWTEVSNNYVENFRKGRVRCCCAIHDVVPSMKLTIQAWNKRKASANWARHGISCGGRDRGLDAKLLLW